jgi:hypothetical protein
MIQTKDNAAFILQGWERRMRGEELLSSKAGRGGAFILQGWERRSFYPPRLGEEDERRSFYPPRLGEGDERRSFYPPRLGEGDERGMRGG